MNKTDQTNPKLLQFTEELNSLLQKYQYRLVPQIQSSASGIIPFLSVKDIIPPKDIPTPIPTKEIVKPLKKVRMFKK